MTTYTVKQTGGDYSSLNAALAAAVTGDVISIEGSWTVDDTTAATIASGDDGVTVQIGDAAAAHNGYWDTSENHYRLVVSTNSHALTLIGTSPTIDGLAIKQAGTGPSNEGIRVGYGSTGSGTIKNCLITSARAGNDQDGIFVYYQQDNTVNVENCVIWDFSRRGIGFDQTAVRSTGANVINVNSCTIVNNGTSDEGLSAGIGLYISAGTYKSITVNVHNCIVMDNDKYSGETCADIVQSKVDIKVERATLNVAYTIVSDSSITDTGITDIGGNLASRTETDSSSPGTGDWVIFEDITTSPYDFRLLGNDENDAQNAHTTSTATTLTIPSADIVGTARPQLTSYDIGAFELEAVPTALSAVSVSTTPTVGSTSIGQEHTLSSDSVGVSPTLGVPAVQQEHTLGATGINSNPLVGNPYIAQTHVMLGLGIAIGEPTVAEPTIHEIHVLAGTGINTHPGIDIPVLACIVEFEPVFIRTTPTLGIPDLTHVHALYANTILSSTLFSEVHIGQTHTLNSLGIDSVLPTVGTPNFGQLHSVSGFSIGTQPIVGTTVLIETHALTSISVDFGHPTVGQPILSDTPSFTSDGIITTPSTGLPLLGQIHSIGSSSINTWLYYGVPDNGQIHVLQSNGLTTSVAASIPDLRMVHVLLGSNIVTTPNVSSTNISTVHTLAASYVTANSIVGVPSAGLVHALTARRIGAVTSISSPSVGQLNVLEAGHIHSQPVIGLVYSGVIHSGMYTIFRGISIGFTTQAETLEVSKTFYQPKIIFSTQEE